MDEETLSLQMRPKTLDAMIGAKRTREMIRSHYASKRKPKGWTFVGETGSGKTTLARILAVSLNCPHQETFGNPCEECYDGRAMYDIIEINASDSTGIDEIRDITMGAMYEPRPPSKNRMYIIDEAQRLSDSAQNHLLKPFEEAPITTTFAICTTAPTKIIRPLRQRTLVYTMPKLGLKSLAKLVSRAMTVTKSKKDAEALVDALSAAGVTSPRAVVQAVEKYLAGATAAEAALVMQESSVDTLAICRSLVKGEWDDVASVLRNATPDDARAIKGTVGGYIKTMLLGASGKNATRYAEMLVSLSQPADESMQLPFVSAKLYDICKLFRGQ